MSEVNEKISKLAADVLVLSRNTLVVNLRFMDKAISMLKFVELSGFNNVAVDGESIGYDPVFVLESYKVNKNLPTRQYLHMVFHCIFQHFFVGLPVNQDAWDLACDIAVENAINELGLHCTEIGKKLEQEKVISSLQKKVKYMTAEVLYRYFCDLNMSSDEMWEMRQLFFRDDHEIWFHRELQISLSAVSVNGKLIRMVSNDSEGSDGSGQSNTQRGSEMESEVKSRSKLRDEWKKISSQMQIDLETFSRFRGDTAGTLIQNLNSVNREKYDYSTFLKKFSVLGEAMKVNDEEFDYIFYTYGLNMYKKMPLIEPLEYKEVKRIKEFVIAIDTSGSTSGSLVQTFIQKTYNILKQQESFFTRINLHIIQCDAEIQEKAKITNQDEFDVYLKTMEIHGLGGTDFRPVFSYVDDLIENHEFHNLNGLIYFTDGFGVFPEKQPDYKVAFVFVNEGYENPEVPVWAIKLVLQPEEIEEDNSEY